MPSVWLDHNTILLWYWNWSFTHNLNFKVCPTNWWCNMLIQWLSILTSFNILKSNFLTFLSILTLTTLTDFFLLHLIELCFLNWTFEIWLQHQNDRITNRKNTSLWRNILIICKSILILLWSCKNQIFFLRHTIGLKQINSILVV